MSFSENLKIFRKQKGLSQKELSQKLDVDQTNCSVWERGICYPKVSTLLKICDILEVTPNQLFDYDFDENCMQEKFDHIAKELDSLCETIEYAKKKVVINK